MSRRIDRPSVDLPLPLSPTMPTMRPRPMSSETSRSTCTSPRAVAKETPRLRTERSARHGSTFSLGSMASRSASPNSVKPSVAKVSARPAKIAVQADWSRCA